MHKAVKENADNGNIERLKYMFVDCLNVDPTFEDYKEDYKYCIQKVPELFERHREITPLRKNQGEWNHDYWVELKIDLIDNFSKERFEHMREVAKVLYAGKIKTINEQREKLKAQNTATQKTQNVKTPERSNPNNRTNSANKPSKREEENRKLEEARERLARENQAIEKKIEAQNRQYNSGEDNGLKKMIGVLLTIVVLLIILLMILNNIKRTP